MTEITPCKVLALILAGKHYRVDLISLLKFLCSVRSEFRQASAEYTHSGHLMDVCRSGAPQPPWKVKTLSLVSSGP